MVSTKQSEQIREAIKEFTAKSKAKRPEDERHWVRFRASPPMLPTEGEGLAVLKPSGEKLVMVGWRGQPDLTHFLNPERKPLPLTGTTDDGQPVRVVSKYSSDSSLVTARDAVQVIALRGSEIVLGKRTRKASEAVFRLTNFFLDTVPLPRKKPYRFKHYKPCLWFKADNLKVFIRGRKPRPDPMLEYDQPSHIQLIASRPLPVTELTDIGWRITNLLSLASAQFVGYQDVTFRNEDRRWTLGYDRSIPPLRSAHRIIENPFSRKGLPLLIKTGLRSIERAHKRFGFYLALRHYIQAQHASSIQDIVTSLFQGFEACISAFRAHEKPIAVLPKDWKRALECVEDAQTNPTVDAGVKQALYRMQQQVRNEPSAKQVLSMLLNELALSSDLKFWHLRQDMFHRGDIDRQPGLDKVVAEMREADDLLARILLRMVGFSGGIWRHPKRYVEMGHVP